MSGEQRPPTHTASSRLSVRAMTGQPRPGGLGGEGAKSAEKMESWPHLGLARGSCAHSRGGAGTSLVSNLTRLAALQEAAGDDSRGAESRGLSVGTEDDQGVSLVAKT